MMLLLPTGFGTSLKFYKVSLRSKVGTFEGSWGNLCLWRYNTNRFLTAVEIDTLGELVARDGLVSRFGSLPESASDR